MGLGTCGSRVRVRVRARVRKLQLFDISSFLGQNRNFGIPSFDSAKKDNFDFSISKFPELLKGIRKFLSTLLEAFEQFELL